MYFYITLISSLVFDFFTKILAQNFLVEKTNIIKDIFFLKYVENSWIAFGISLPFIKIITIILILAILLYYFKEERKKKDKILDISFWLILWWAIWNWVERVFFWNVTDFIWVSFFSIFNFADIFICIWAIIYFVYLFKTKE